MRRGRAVPQASQPEGRPNEVELHIGHQIRLRRMLLGMTQDALASKIGVKRQQLQHYEHGTNSFGAATLYAFATVLGVPVNWFFEGLSPVDSTRDLSRPPVSRGEHLSVDHTLDPVAAARPRKGITELAIEEVFHPGADARTKKGIIDVIRAFQRIKDAEQRAIILEEAKRLAQSQE